MSARPYVWRTPLVISLMFVASVVVLIGNAVFFYRNQQSLTVANEWITHTRGVLERLAEVRASIGDAEASVRGYALTGQDTFLQPYVEAKSKLSKLFENLEVWVADDQVQTERLGRLEQLVTERLGQLEEMVDFRRRAVVDAPPSAEAFDAGRRTMEQIRGVVSDMGEEERQLYATRVAVAQRTEQSALAGSLAAAAFGVVSFAIFYYLLGVYLRQRHRAERALAEINETLEKTVITRTAELSDLSQYLLTVIEDERVRIARELHDELGSTLTAVHMDLTWMREHIAPDATELHKRLERIHAMLASTLAIKRRLIENLRPSLLDNLGLGAAIEAYVADFSKTTGIHVEHTLTEDLDELPEHCPIAVFRVLQEALTNVARHAQATRVTVKLERTGDNLVLEVGDDGIGISPTARAKLKSHGLVGMRERAQQLGGRFDIGPGVGGKGTLIRAVVPCPKKKKPSVSPAVQAEE